MRIQNIGVIQPTKQTNKQTNFSAKLFDLKEIRVVKELNRYRMTFLLKNLKEILPEKSLDDLYNLLKEKGGKVEVFLNENDIEHVNRFVDDIFELSKIDKPDDETIGFLLGDKTNLFRLLKNYIIKSNFEDTKILSDANKSIKEVREGKPIDNAIVVNIQKITNDILSAINLSTKGRLY